MPLYVKSHSRGLAAKQIERVIVVLRGHKVMLDSGLAALYGTSTKRLNEKVRRNRERFSTDFMLQLTNQELSVLRSQFATSNKRPQGNCIK